jgi:hypothetical protein
MFKSEANPQLAALKDCKDASSNGASFSKQRQSQLKAPCNGSLTMKSCEPQQIRIKDQPPIYGHVLLLLLRSTYTSLVADILSNLLFWKRKWRSYRQDGVPPAQPQRWQLPSDLELPQQLFLHSYDIRAVALK